MNEGYIKLFRKTLDNPIICKDSDHLAVWVYLLLNATHREMDVLFNNKRITLKPGQLITGRKSISSKLNISESKVQRIIKTLKSEQQIEQQTSNKNRLITILNWQSYQFSEQQSEQQVNNKRTTSEQQVNTNKNDKNVKNDKNERSKDNSSRFTPPTLTELTSYIVDNKYQVNPETFINHYEAVGWKVGKNKMKDWKAAVRGWHSRNKKDIPQEEIVPDYMQGIEGNRVGSGSTKQESMDEFMKHEAKRQKLLEKLKGGS